jgi:hypothetical protein
MQLGLIKTAIIVLQTAKHMCNSASMQTMQLGLITKM